MSISTRELYLALRVRDEGTRNLQRFAQELVRTGTAARVAGLKAQADQLREQAAQIRAAAAIERTTATRLRDRGASQAQVRAAQAHANALTREAQELTNNAAALDRQATAIQRNSQRLGHLTGTLTQTGVALETIGVAFGFMGAAGVSAMKDTLTTAIAYQKQVALTATQLDDFGVHMQEIHDIGIRLAKTIAVPFESIQPALFDIFSSLEVSIPQAESLLTSFAKAGVAGNVDMQEASRATIGIMNAFAIPVEDVNHLLDMQFQLVKEGIGSYQEWNERIGAVSPSAVRAGQSIEIMLAALATTTRLGIPASRSATAVARAFDAMSNPKAIDKMEELGIKVRNADGSLRPFNLVMREFRDILQDIPEKDRVGTILEVFKGAGSTIEARKFLQSMLLGTQGLEMFDMILDRVTNTSGSFEEAYQLMADTTASKSQIMMNKWDAMKESIGAALIPTLEKVMGFFTGLMDKFNDMSPEMKNTIAQWLLWGSVAVIVIGVMLTVIGILAVFIASVVAAGSVLGTVLFIASGIGAVFTGLGAAMILAWQNSESFRAGVKQGWDDLKQLAGTLKQTWDGIVSAFNENLMPSLQKLWDFIDQKIIPQWNQFRSEVWDKVYPIIKETGAILVDLAEWGFKKLGQVIENDIIPLIRKLSEWWDRNKESLMPVITILAQFAKWFIIIAAIIVGVVIVAFVALVVVVIGSVVAAFVAIVEAVQAVWGWLVFLWNNVLKPVGQAIGDFFEWVKAKLKGIGEAVWGFLDDAKNTVMNFRNDMVAAAKNLIDGFIQGINEKFGSAVAVIRNLGGAVINALKAVLGIASPSKVAMQLGMQTAQGYILGYQNTMASAIMGQDQFLGTNPRSIMLPQTTQGPVGVGQMQPGALMQPSGGEKKTITNHITIQTNEMVPREVAAQLGWELAGRM